MMPIGDVNRPRMFEHQGATVRKEGLGRAATTPRRLRLGQEKTTGTLNPDLEFQAAGLSTTPAMPHWLVEFVDSDRDGCGRRRSIRGS